MDWVKEKMYQARLQRNKLKKHGYITSPDIREEDNMAVPATLYPKFLSLYQKLIWLVGGMALGVVIVSMVWRVEPIGAGNQVAGNTPEQRHQLITLPVQSDTNEIKEELVNLTRQIQMLTASVADLQVKLLETRSVTNSIASAGKGVEQDGSQQQLSQTTDNVAEPEVLPPPATGLNDKNSPEGKETVKSAVVTDSTLIASAEQTTAANREQTHETTKESGPWVINLASLPHKADAERFLDKAKSRGIAAGIYQVTVKGKTYWRVHVPGFATVAEAKSNAGMIKKKLGLKDVWVAKR